MDRTFAPEAVTAREPAIATSATRDITDARIDTDRTPLSCPTLFWLNGRIYHAEMQNISEGGAQFSTAAMLCGPVNMMVGDVLEMSIQTPYGPAERTGTVRWKERWDGMLRWGVKFDWQPVDEGDPLAVIAAKAA